MRKKDMEAYLPQLKKLIKDGRTEQAKQHLSALPTLQTAEIRQVIEILALAPDKISLDLLPYLISETSLSPDIAERLFQLVSDRSHINFSFSRIIMEYGGRERILTAIPLLKHVLTKETDENLLGDILRNAGKFQINELVDDAAEFIFYDNTMLKAEAVRALERICTPLALVRLEKVARTEKCDRDILDAIYIVKQNLEAGTSPARTALPKAAPAPSAPGLTASELPASASETPPPEPAGPALPESPAETASEPEVAATPADAPSPRTEPAPSGTEPARAEPETPVDTAREADTPEFKENLKRLSSEKLAERYKAFAYFTDKSSRVSAALSIHRKTRDHDLMVCLLRLVSRTIPQSSLGDLLTLVSEDVIPVSVKFAAYDALYAYPELTSAAAIIKGILDHADHVRMAAVKVLGKNNTDYVVAEIRNKIESGTKTGEALAQTILDVGEGHLIDALVNSDSFTYIASNYLEKNPTLTALDAYINVLEARKRKSSARKYIDLRAEIASQARETVMVVSPSPIYLTVYKKRVFAAGCYCKTYTGTQDAFEALVSDKPAAVICDTFLNNMTAVDFAKEARELYRKEELPIIISCLQRDLDKKLVKTELETSGVSGICDFPARAGTIRSWIRGA